VPEHSSVASPPRLLPLLAQWDVSLEMLHERLEGLTDDECVWEPAPGAATVVRTDDGRWRPSDAPEVGGVRTIAWLFGHLGEAGTERADYLVGSHSLVPGSIEWPAPTVAEGLRFLDAGLGAWRSALDEMSDRDLDTVGRSQYPGGRDRNLPLLDIVWWMNRELIHHAAEMSYVRDLYGQAQRIDPRRP
jgi:DinB superfamily